MAIVKLPAVLRYFAEAVDSRCEGFWNRLSTSVLGSISKATHATSISSQLWSPHRTSDFESGLSRLPSELSHTPATSNRVPRGAPVGSWLLLHA